MSTTLSADPRLRRPPPAPGPQAQEVQDAQAACDGEAASGRIGPGRPTTRPTDGSAPDLPGANGILAPRGASDAAETTVLCRRCGGGRLARVLARCSDMCGVDLAGRHTRGHVPRDLGIGCGDDIHFRYCLDCGQIQGAFPLPPTEIERDHG